MEKRRNHIRTLALLAAATLLPGLGACHGLHYFSYGGHRSHTTQGHHGHVVVHHRGSRHHR